MEENTGIHWDVTPEMPHDTIMDQKRLHYDDLSAAIQREIRSFDTQYDIALKDGFTEEERQSLTTRSYEIAKRIEIEYPDKKDDNDNNAGTAIAVVFVGILAAFGLNKILQS